MFLRQVKRLALHRRSPPPDHRLRKAERDGVTEEEERRRLSDQALYRDTARWRGDGSVG